MEYLIGALAALFTPLVLKLLSIYVFKFTISQFMVGWLSCMVFYNVIKAYEDYEK